jgi:hypothetical protein
VRHLRPMPGQLSFLEVLSTPRKTSKQCTRCELVKSFDEFSPTRGGKFGRNSKCKQCINNETRLWREQNIERIRAYNRRTRMMRRDGYLRRTYGISLEQYSEMLAAQGGVCEICKEEETFRGGRNGDSEMPLAIDHDHETGEIRGLLCTTCNKAIGAMRDDPARLDAAAAYLRKYRRLSGRHRAA